MNDQPQTPRDVLLGRHRPAGPKLDAIRRAVVAREVCDRPAERRPQPWAGLAGVLGTPWRELILPNRRLWSGLAAVWVAILVINCSQHETLNSVTGKPARAPALALNWQAQQRWMSELLADRAVPAEAERAPSAAPRPRTALGKTERV